MSDPKPPVKPDNENPRGASVSASSPPKPADDAAAAKAKADAAAAAKAAANAAADAKVKADTAAADAAVAAAAAAKAKADDAVDAKAKADAADAAQAKADAAAADAKAKADAAAAAQAKADAVTLTITDRLDLIEQRLGVAHTPNNPVDITPLVGSMDLLPPVVKAEDDKCLCDRAHVGEFNPKCPMHGEVRQKEIAAMMVPRVSGVAPATAPAPVPGGTYAQRAPGDK